MLAAWWASLIVGSAQDSVVVFNEVHYRTTEGESEWIELHNQMAADVDLSGWRLRGGIRFDFPVGTVLGGGEYLVVAADPTAVRNRGPFIELLGPYEGRLNNGGETIRLEDRSTLGTVSGGTPRHRVMDELSYPGDAVSEESLGFTWAKRDPDGGTAFASNWMVSARDGGTPGARNFRDGVPERSIASHMLGPLVINEILYRARPHYESAAIPGDYDSSVLIETSSSWKADSSGEEPPETWIAGATDWPTMDGPFGVGLSNAPVAVQATLPLKKANGGSVNVYHFTHAFRIEEGVSSWQDLALDLLVDDGAIVYLNGEEIYRRNLPEGPLTTRTSAVEPIQTLEWIEVPGIDPNRLQVGENVLAVAVHQHFTLFEKSDDAVFAAQLRGRVETRAPVPAQPHRESSEEWIELYNRSAEIVDLSGWTLSGGVEHEISEGTTLPAGAYLVIDSFRGTLSNGGEPLILSNADGQIIDEVHYRDNGRWPREADGDGASLELRHPDIDNRVAESWAASDERARSSWQTYTYEGVAVNDGIGTSLYHEIVIGMLDAGEVLLDDIEVIEDPHGSAIAFMQNGDFEDGDLGEMPDHWLAVGTHGSHGRTRLVEDPDEPGNQVLHLVATGATEDKHNQLTSVYANGERVRSGQTYRITFRAKWLSGANLLNTRLYFNDLQRTTRLAVPETGGSPGSANTTLDSHIGPTMDLLSQSPVLPTADEPVTVSLRVEDPDGIDTVTLTYAINGGTLFSGGTHSVTMTPENDRYTAIIPGRSVGDLVRIHMTATDAMGNESFFPREGPDARALYEVVSNATLADGPHRFRVLMEDKDRTILFADANRMSNDRIRGTVIYKNIAYHNVGIRLKGSAWARNNAPYQGLNIRFDPEQPFRGVHETVSLERDPGKGEILAHHLFSAAGGKLPSFHNDVVQLDFDQPTFTGRVLLLMGRTSGPFLRGTFDNASEGTVYNLELLYTPQATLDRRPESPKRPYPYTHDNGRYDFRVMGPDKEAYRWGFQIRSGRDRDQYGAIVRAGEAMDETGLAFDRATAAAFDIDQWARAFAMMALNGNDDFYTRLWEHNLRLYHRAEDDRLLAIPWDFDRAWRLSATSPLIGNLNNAGTPTAIPRLFERPANLRLFHGHILDLLDTVFNETYVDPWARHYGSLFRSSLNSVTSYVRSRADFARRQLPEEIPFTIVTNGGDDFTTDQALVSLQGRGWINVHEIRLAGEAFALPVTWRNGSSWTAEVPIAPGSNAIRLEAFDLQKAMVGTATITITGTAQEVLANAENLVLSEIHYHPKDDTPTEFIELWNPSNVTVLLNGVRFDDGIVFAFDDAMLGPGERALLVQDRSAFMEAYPGARVLGQYTGRLSNSGETVRLLGANGAAIAAFTYHDDAPWPAAADGQGSSLVFRGGDANDAANWTISTAPGGNPGEGEDIGTPLDYAAWKQIHQITDDSGDADRDGLSNLLEYALGGDLREDSSSRLPHVHPEGILSVTTRTGVTDIELSLETSSDLETWRAAETFEVIARFEESGLTVTSYRMMGEDASRSQYLRLRVHLTSQ